MTPTPTPRQLQELQNLRHNTDILDYLSAALEYRKAKLVFMSDPMDVQVCQGQAQAYKELIDAILGNAPVKSVKRP